jgi:hypothetical protein
MRSLFENKRLVLLLAALALAALTVLALSLNAIPFREAQRYAEPEVEQVQAPITPPPQVGIGTPLWKQILVMGLLTLIVILIGALISPRFRKRLFGLLLRIVVWGVAIYIILTNPIMASMFANILRARQLKPQGLKLGDESLAPMPVFQPPPASSTLAYVISFAFAVLLLAVLWGLYRGWKRYAELNSTKKPLVDIARIARSSLHDLSDGRDSSDVIINCYLRMSDVVASKRRLRREIAMTPREFAAFLEQAGLPADAVTQLTCLFEGVRYGDRRSAPKDVNEAVRCLQTILHYCGEPV